MNVLLWGVLPYVVLALLVGGTLWRYRYDQFGWTTRSSQLYESRLLRIGSPLFHFGLVFVLVGHIVGLVIPKSWTEALGVSQTLYHVNALVVGGLAGVCTLLGVSILVYRRRTTGTGLHGDHPQRQGDVRRARRRPSCSGCSPPWPARAWSARSTTTGRRCPCGSAPSSSSNPTSTPWPRRRGPSTCTCWSAMLLFAIWPFTRLVHAFTAPLHYLFRPYIVYRSRDDRPGPGNAAPRRGWAPVGTKDRDR